MKNKLKTLWTIIILVCMVFIVGHLIWSANTTIFNNDDVIEQTFTKRN